MQNVEIQALPKQSATIVLENILYEIDLIETNGCMSLNLTRAGVRVCSGLRVVAGTPLLPYLFMELANGNFMFLTDNGDMPAWEQFGKTQSLVYASNAEMEALRDGAT